MLGGILAAAVALSLTGCGMIGSSISYRYRMTVEVDTPEGLKRGSSIIEVDTWHSRGLEGTHLDVRVTGDAVAVDLPGGDTLLALLDRATEVADCGIIPPRRESAQAAAAAGHDDPNEWREEILDLKARPGICELPRMGPSPFPTDGMVNQWPTLVHFRDLRDPHTLEPVDPDNPAATLGANVRIRRIIVQITNDAVTTGLEKRLPWLDHLDHYLTDPANPFTSTLPKGINQGNLVMKRTLV